MNMRFIIILLVSSMNVFAQEVAFSKYNFSIGYGYYDLIRNIYENHNGMQLGYLFDVKKSLVGPIYLKSETNISKKVGLALCFAYESFSHAASSPAAKVTQLNTGMSSYSIGFSQDNYPNPDSSYIVTNGTVREKVTYSSFSINLRTNFYLVNRPKTKLYLGVGVGYRMYKHTRENNVNELYPELGHQIYILNDLNFYNPVGGELTFGFRYFVFKNTGLYAEMGLAKSLFQVGICSQLSKK